MNVPPEIEVDVASTYSRRQTSALLGVDPRRVNKMINLGQLEAVEIGARLEVTGASIDELLAKVVAGSAR